MLGINQLDLIPGIYEVILFYRPGTLLIGISKLNKVPLRDYTSIVPNFLENMLLISRPISNIDLALNLTNVISILSKHFCLYFE